MFQILLARQALTVPEKDPGDDGSDEPKEEEKPEEEKPGDLKIDLDDQRDELKRISAEINHISDGLKEPEKENPAPEKPGQGDDGVIGSRLLFFCTVFRFSVFSGIRSVIRIGIAGVFTVIALARFFRGRILIKAHLR